MSSYVKNECWECKHVREIPGDCHVGCTKPDPDMTGNPHGIRNGWFVYPACFDPAWMTKKCANFDPRNKP